MISYRFHPPEQIVGLKLYVIPYRRFSGDLFVLLNRYGNIRRIGFSNYYRI
jgi:hypothetical protein